MLDKGWSLVPPIFGLIGMFVLLRPAPRSTAVSDAAKPYPTVDLEDCAPIADEAKPPAG